MSFANALSFRRQHRSERIPVVHGKDHRAPTTSGKHLGYFVYCLTDRHDGAKGAYEPWWDSRSDWNHNLESAAFVSLSHTLGWEGFRNLFQDERDLKVLLTIPW